LIVAAVVASGSASFAVRPNQRLKLTARPEHPVFTELRRWPRRSLSAIR